MIWQSFCCIVTVWPNRFASRVVLAGWKSLSDGSRLGLVTGSGRTMAGRMEAESVLESRGQKVSAVVNRMVVW